MTVFDGFTVLKARRADCYFIIKSLGLNVGDCFEEGDNVVIVGTSLLARCIYHDIKNRVNVLGFMDAVPSHDEMENLPVWHGVNRFFWSAAKKCGAVKVIAVDYTDIGSIEATFKPLPLEWDLVLVEAIMYAVYYKDFLKRRHLEKRYEAKEDPLICWNRKTEAFDNVLFSMSLYVIFLYMMINDSWHKDTWCCALAGSESMAGMFHRGFQLCDVMVSCDSSWYAKEDVFMTRLRIVLLAEYAKRHNITVVGVDHSSLAGFFFGTNFILLEDGNWNYQDKSTWFQITMPDGGTYISGGYNDYVKQIVLTGRAEAPAELQSKYLIISLREIWKEKNEAEKKRIKDFFEFPEERIKKLLSEGRDHWLVTGNYYAAAMMTEEQQISVYGEILAKYDQKRVVIKPHPNDYLDYKQHFPDCEVVSGFFPMELLPLEGIVIRKIIGVNSTAMMGIFPPDMVDSYPEYEHCDKFKN